MGSLHTYADRAALALRDVEVFTVQLSAFRLGAEGDSTPALTQPAGVHAVHLSLGKLLSIVDTLGRDLRRGQAGRKKRVRPMLPSLN